MHKEYPQSSAMDNPSEFEEKKEEKLFAEEPNPNVPLPPDIIEDEEFFDEEYEDDDLVGGNYEAPEDKDSFIDTGDGRVIDKKDLTPFEIIKAIAKQTGNKIRDPKPSCKHCYGRGWIGKDYKTQMPIPCNCIYPPKTPAEKEAEQPRFPMSRKARRKMQRAYKTALKKGRIKPKEIEDTQEYEPTVADTTMKEPTDEA